MAQSPAKPKAAVPTPSAGGGRRPYRTVYDTECVPQTTQGSPCGGGVDDRCIPGTRTGGGTHRSRPTSHVGSPCGNVGRHLCVPPCGGGVDDRCIPGTRTGGGTHRSRPTSHVGSPCGNVGRHLCVPPCGGGVDDRCIPGTRIGGGDKPPHLTGLYIINTSYAAGQGSGAMR